MKVTIPLICLFLSLCISCSTSDKEQNESTVSEPQEEPINIEGHWLNVKSVIQYDGEIVSYPKDSAYILFENDSIYRGEYPYRGTYGFQYSISGDTVYDDQMKPIYKASFKGDTLLLNNLGARLQSVSYFVPCKFDSDVIGVLKTSRVNWRSHQFLWVFEESDDANESCDITEEFPLDLRPSNQQNYFFVDDELSYIVGKDTIRFSYVLSRDSTLNLLHNCDAIFSIHSFSFRKEG